MEYWYVTADPTKNIGSVCAGQIVSVMAFLVPNGSGVRTKANTGIPPHVVYKPTENETSNYCPGTVKIQGTLPTDAEDFYRIDLGQPFFCPWAGQLQLDGGFGVGSAPTLQFSIKRHQMPIACVLQPTFTVKGLTTTGGLKVPRGAKRVHVPFQTELIFSGYNSPQTITVDPGEGYPLGYLNQGTVRLGTFGSDSISFSLEIA